MQSVSVAFIVRRIMHAQSAYPRIQYREYSRCLPDFLRSLAEEARQRREREIAKLTDPASIRGRQQYVRNTLWEIAGAMPTRTALHMRVTGLVQRERYRIEKLIYESRPGLHIPANLYVPKGGASRYPGVLFQMGHAPNGKAASTYQRCCQGLVQLGFVVLAFDPMGQGERIYYPDSSGIRTQLSSADEEHSLPGRQMILTGDTATRFQLWDAIRSLDVLAAHPAVDARRLATAGQSGGATLSMFLAAVDNRLAAAVVCSGNTENFTCANFNPPGSTDDAEQNLVGAGPLGLDRWDLLYPLAPKPLLISVSSKDAFGTYSPNYIGDGRDEFNKLRRVYEQLGQPDRIEWNETPLPHGLSYDTRMALYRWLQRWLQPNSEALTEEPPTSVEEDRPLWCSESGNVVRSFHGETPHTLMRKQTIERKTGDLRTVLAIHSPKPDLRATIIGSVPSRNITIDAIEIAVEPNIVLPAWVFAPKRHDTGKPAVILLEPAGRNGRWHEGEMYQSLAETGAIVCVPDLRGIGDMTPEFGRGAARYVREHNTEDEYAWASLILGRPMLGQRVTDILAILQAFRNHAGVDGRRCILAAQGKLTVPALIAAALDVKTDALYLSAGLSSFRSIVETERYSHAFANFVPNFLSYTDLPEIAASIAPRKIVLAGIVDGAGTTMTPAAAAAAYGNQPHVQVHPTAKWDTSLLETV
jgi:dienelactone hydrolase